MARNQQPRALRQQVERLVTEKKADEAFRLLKKSGWVPGGSGHQEYYPHGLTLYVQVDWEKQILVSEGKRFWAWEVATLAPDEYTFLYPTSRQFPFDEVCSEIVRQLERRNWDVPGIQVDFETYGSGAQKFRMIRHLQSADFKLWFCRVQRLLSGGHYNDIAGVTELAIPGMKLSVYEDESGPTFYVYVGRNWVKDRERFFNGSMVNSKLYKEPRTYLRYKGSFCKPTDPGPHYTYSKRRAPYLVHDNDLGREYGLGLGDNSYFVTAMVMTQIAEWLRDNVLARIMDQPIPDELVVSAVKPSTPDFPKEVGSLFCFGEWGDAERINKGRQNVAELDVRDRYGMQGNGYRLASLDVRQDGTFPEVAYDGFLWCGIGEVTPETPIESLDVPGHYRWSDRERFVIRITPKTARGIYVADFSGQPKYKTAIWQANPNQDRLGDAEYREFVRIPARTLVPITEYRGGYEQPVVLINRELGFDEVEVVSGPHKDR